MELSEQIKAVKSSVKKLEFYYQQLEAKFTKYGGELDKSVYEAKKAIDKLEAAALKSEGPSPAAEAEGDFEPKQPPKPELKEGDSEGLGSDDDEATEHEAPKTAWPGPTVE